MSRITNAKEQISSAIKLAMPFYSRGYIDVKKDFEGVAIPYEGETVVFPSDYLGDYFYIRQEGNISWTPKKIEEHKLILVSYTENTDTNILLENLSDILVRKCAFPFGIRLLNATTDTYSVVRSEVAKKGIKTALKNIKNNISLLKIEFVVVLPSPNGYKKDECMTKPCKTC